MSRYAVNLLALPKDNRIMKCFVAPKGCVLGQFDLAAVEPHVLTYFSKDPTLQKIYGKGAWPHHDIYFIAGMKVPGLITNVTKFGAFVDIGVHQDGLIHISKLKHGFVADPAEVVRVRQQVEVKVIEVDAKRKRISLSLID